MKKPLLLLTTTLGALCFAIGWLAMMSRGGPEHVLIMGHALTISGAIILAGVLISFAITVKK